MTTTRDTVADACVLLDRWGLSLVGSSSKSCSAYYGLSSDADVRMRVSDHAVAYASSDCAVCLGVSEDDDFRLDGDNSEEQVRLAVVALIRATIAAEVEDMLGTDYDDELDPAAVKSEAKSKWATWATQRRKSWASLVEEA